MLRVRCRREEDTSPSLVGADTFTVEVLAAGLLLTAVLEDRKRDPCWYIDPCDEDGEDPNSEEEATVLATDAAVIESLRVKALLVLILAGGVEASIDEAGWMLDSCRWLF